MKPELSVYFSTIVKLVMTNEHESKQHFKITVNVYILNIIFKLNSNGTDNKIIINIINEKKPPFSNKIEKNLRIINIT